MAEPVDWTALRYNQPAVTSRRCRREIIVRLFNTQELGLKLSSLNRHSLLWPPLNRLSRLYIKWKGPFNVTC